MIPDLYSQVQEAWFVSDIGLDQYDDQQNLIDDSSLPLSFILREVILVVLGAFKLSTLS
jgi:hypothetical protein